MRKYLSSLLLLCATLTWQSCLHENTTVFEQPALERLEAAAQQTQQILESSPNGWLLRYYAGQSYSGPAYSVLMKFDNGKATVVSDYDQDKTTTAPYSIAKDQGVVLSFDSYNEAMHTFARVWEGSGARGIEGDYEFLVLSTSNDTIRLRGKKWKNDMELIRMPEKTNWTSYLTSIYNLKEQLTTQFFALQLGKDTLTQATLNPLLHRLSFTVDNYTYDAPFTFAPNSIDLLRPITLNGKTYSSFTWQKDTQSFVNGELSLGLIIPKSYRKRDEWIGDWRLNCNAFSLSKAVNTRRYPVVLHILKYSERQPDLFEANLSFNGQTYGPLNLIYDPAVGTIKFPGGQILADKSGTYPGGILLTPGIVKTGTLVQEPEIGVTLKWNPEQNKADVEYDETTLGTLDAFMGIGINYQQEPMLDDKGNPVVPILIANIRDASPVKR